MKGKWSVTKGRGSKSVSGVNVAKFVKAGGKKYNLVTDNCQDGADRMYQLGDDKLGKRGSCKG